MIETHLYVPTPALGRTPVHTAGCRTRGFSVILRLRRDEDLWSVRETLAPLPYRRVATDVTAEDRGYGVAVTGDCIYRKGEDAEAAAMRILARLARQETRPWSACVFASMAPSLKRAATFTDGEGIRVTLASDVLYMNIRRELVLREASVDVYTYTDGKPYKDFNKRLPAI